GGRTAPARGRAGDAPPGVRAPALAPAARRALEGRARDERDDRRGGRLPAPLPGPARPRRDDAPLGRVDPLAPAPRRVVGDVLRRARRPVDDRRGVRRAADRRRPAGGGAHAPGGLVRPRRRRRRGEPGLHAHVALAPLALVVGRVADAAAGADPAPAVGAALGLRVRLLGPPDDRRAPDRDRAPAAHHGRLRDPRAHEREAGAGAPARPGAAALRAPAGARAPPPRARRGRALDPRAPGAGRLLGRDPAALGLVDDRAPRPRLRARPPRPAARAR